MVGAEAAAVQVVAVVVLVAAEAVAVLDSPTLAEILV
jgi:hypothetical protein